MEKEKLYEYRNLKHKQRNVIEKKMLIESEIAGIKAINYDKIGGKSSKHCDLSDAMVKLEAVDVELVSLNQQLADKLLEFISLFETLDNPLAETMMAKHYLENKTYRQIASEVNYSLRHVKRVMAESITEICEKN